LITSNSSCIFRPEESQRLLAIDRLAKRERCERDRRIRQQFQHRVERKLERPADGAETERMGAAHESDPTRPIRIDFFIMVISWNI
jgi:hypothetical protein